MSTGLSMYDGLGKETVTDNNTLERGVSNGTTKKLTRGISRATENAAIVSYARTQLTSLGPLETPEFTFSLPDLSVYPGLSRIPEQFYSIEPHIVTLFHFFFFFNIFDILFKCQDLWCHCVTLITRQL